MEKYKLFISHFKLIPITLFILAFSIGCDGGGGNGGDGDGGSQTQAASPCDNLVPTITGTNGDDNITGTQGPDIIVGLGGDDRIDGLGGNDIICGDAGNDNIMGGLGIDILDGGPGDDIVDGGPGDDILLQAPGSDDIYIGVLVNDELFIGQALEEISFTNAESSIFFDITSDEVEEIDNNGNTLQTQGIFPNVYGSFNPDTFFFSNTSTFNGIRAHLFDPPAGGGSDVFLIDSNGHKTNVIQEISTIPTAFGDDIVSDTTILIGDTEYRTFGVETICPFNFPPVIIDDSDGLPGFDSGGFTIQPADQGFLDTFRFSGPGDGNTATWSFANIPNGTYVVSTTFEAFADRATDAPYTLSDGGAPITIDINQEEAPDDFQDQGADWVNIALLLISNNNLTVELTDDADDFVIADAVRLAPVPICDGLILSTEDFIDSNSDAIELVSGSNPGTLPTSDGSIGSQLDIPEGTTIGFNLTQNSIDKLNGALQAMNTDFFFISTTYAPVPNSGLEITFTFNGVEYTIELDQTTIVPDFSVGNGSVPFQNLAACRTSEDGFIGFDQPILLITPDTVGPTGSQDVLTGHVETIILAPSDPRYEEQPFIIVSNFIDIDELDPGECLVMPN